jgi:EAL domain-containing protein (putative c-di-GMP-specific phosphodiesterase class I)
MVGPSQENESRAVAATPQRTVVPAAENRGGTSKALFVQRQDRVITDPAHRDVSTLAPYCGSDRGQLDRIGEGAILAGKFATLGRSTGPPGLAWPILQSGGPVAAAPEFGRDGHSTGPPHGASHRGGRLRASVGVAVSGRGADRSTLLSAADTATARAKQASDDRVEVTIDVEVDLAPDGDPVQRSVADAIRDGELRVWYQPMVRISDRSVAGVEALVRWAHPSMGLLTPDRFLRDAERAGDLPTLDQWVFTRAAADFVALHRELGDRAPDRVGVNLAPATLGTDFDRVVETVLADTGLPASRLVVELPEDADLEMLISAAPRLERLRSLGVGLVIDDMGSGSTSLRHLSTIAVGGLKIDAAFINGMLHNPGDHTVVKLLAELGHALQLPVTAEGVETADQLSALAELDIEYAQGYHLGRPQPLHQLTALLGIPPGPNPGDRDHVDEPSQRHVTRAWHTGHDGPGRAESRRRTGVSLGAALSDWASWLRESIPSLANTLRRW